MLSHFQAATWQAGQHPWARWGSSLALKSANLGAGPCWEDSRFLDISALHWPSLSMHFAPILSTHHALNRTLSLTIWWSEPSIPWSEPFFFFHPHFTEEDTEPVGLTQGHRVRKLKRSRFSSGSQQLSASLCSSANNSIITDALTVERDDICKVLKSYTHVRCSSCYN